MSELISHTHAKLSLRAYLLPLCGCVALLFFISPICNAQTLEREPEESVVQARPATRQIGDVTSALLAMQVDGSMAGRTLPMLGATSALSWERYKDSFKYKIPEVFDRAIRKNDSQ